MASCGPSNGFQNMKNHVERDASLQRESARRADPVQRAFRPARRDGAAQFEAFNTFSARETDFRNDMSFGRSNIGPVPPLATAPSVPRAVPSDVGYMSHSNLTQNAPLGSSHKAGPASREWINEFQSYPGQEHAAHNADVLSRTSAYGTSHLSGPQSYRQPYGPAHAPYDSAYGPSYGPSYGPQFASQFGTPQFGSPRFGTPSLADQQLSAVESSSAMEAAFAEAEQSLKNLHLAEAQKQSAPVHEGERENVASDVAAKIINSVNEHADAELSDKVKGSRFMNLMTKLKNNEVKLDSKEFVDTATNSAIAPESLDSRIDASEEYSQDWPPARDEAASRHTSAREQPPEIAEEPKRQYRFSRDLDDPDTYFRKIKENLDSHLFIKSPLEAAHELGPSEVMKSSSWEENYEDW